MNRLTMRNSDGTVSQPMRTTVEAVFYRLAAYEDTGLEPEEVKELAQAQADGLLVRLPCNFKTICAMYGNTIYIVKGGEIIDGVFCSIGFDADGELYCEAGCAPFDEGLEALSFDMAEFGKTVFFALEEAEKVLEGAQV